MTETWYFIVSIAPSVAAIGGILLSALLTIKKVAEAINSFVDAVREFRQSNELKENNKQMEDLLKDNKDLKKLCEKLLVELTKVKPMGWTDDE